MAEHVRVLEVVVEASNGRVPVIGGAGANSTAEALELHGDAKRVGCRACLSVNPYYNKPSQEGLYRHFMTLADRVDLHIVLYNIPSRTGITMSPATVAVWRSTRISLRSRKRRGHSISPRKSVACVICR